MKTIEMAHRRKRISERRVRREDDHWMGANERRARRKQDKWEKGQ